MNRLEDIARRASRLPLAPIAGAMLGAAVALVSLMTPVWMLERFSVDAGLPSFLAAAAPPLGMKARLVLAILAGGAAFLAGAMLVALLDRSAKPRPRKPTIIEEIIEPEDEIPGARQRSFSATDYEAAERTPRPILATRELGVPMDDIVEEKPLAWVTPQAEVTPQEYDEPIELPALWSRSPAEPEQVAAPSGSAEDDWLDLGEFPIADAWPDEEPHDEEADVTEALTSAATEPAASSADEEHSVPTLMARLEAGLVKRGMSGARLNGVGHSDVAGSGAAPVKVKPPIDMDTALRNALQELHRAATGRA